MTNTSTKPSSADQAKTKAQLLAELNELRQRIPQWEAAAAESKQMEQALRASEARFKAVFDCAGVGIALIDPNGPILHSNPALQQMLGYSAAELSQPANLTITHPDDRALTQARMADLLGGRLDSTRLEKRYLHKNGSTVWADLSITPIRTEQGQPVAFIGAMVDITARKEAEAALRASEAKFRQIIERSGDGIFLSDETGQLAEWNPMMEQITGLAQAEVLGRVGWQVRFSLLPTEQQTPLMYEQIKATAQAYFQTGQDPQLNRLSELEIQRRDGSYRDLQELPFSIQSAAGFWRGSIIRDITERKQEARIEAAQLAVGHILAQSPEPAAALRQILESIAGRLEWQVAKLWWPDSDDRHLLWRDGWHAPDQPELAEFEQISRAYTFAPGEGLAGMVWQTGQTIWDQNLRLPTLAAAALAAGLHSATGMPISMGGVTVGVMTFFGRSARPLDERLLAVLTNLGRQIGQFLAHRQAEAALRESKERLELVLAGADLGAWDWHIPSGTVIYNERWAEMLEYSLAEVKPQINSWESLIHPDDFAHVMQATQANLEGQTSLYQTEYRIQTKSGRWKWILDTGKVLVRDEQGRAVRAAGVHQDITARKVAEESLRRYEQMVSTTPDWMALIDRSYVYRIVNQAYLASNNKSYDQVIGHTVAELLGEAVFMMEEIKPYLDQTLAGETVHFQRWFDFPAVGQRFIDVTYAPYREKDGTISGVIVSGRDMTEVKLLEEHLQQAEKLGAIGQLAAGMAHHYNSMLTTIIGFTSLVLDQLPPDNPHAKRLGMVLNTAERMAVFVRQLLAFAQKQLLQPKTVNLNSLVIQLQGELKQLASAPVEFIFELDLEAGQVKVDPRQFEYLLRALVSNALDAMPQGGRLTLSTTNVSLETEEAARYDLPPGNYALLTVHDTGIGLTDEVKAHLFEPFFTTKEIGQGTGLGLAMSLGIAKQHGGHLLAEGKPRQGLLLCSICPVWLPLSHLFSQPEYVILPVCAGVKQPLPP